MQANIPTGNVLQQSKVVCFNRPTSVRYSLYFVVVNELACCCREMVCRFFCRFFTNFADFFEQRRWLKSIFCRFFWNSANNVIRFFCRFFADFFGKLEQRYPIFLPIFCRFFWESEKRTCKFLNPAVCPDHFWSSLWARNWRYQCNFSQNGVQKGVQMPHLVPSPRSISAKE